VSAYTGFLRCPRCATERSDAQAFSVCAPCLAEGVHVNPFPVYDWAGFDPNPIPGRRGLFAWQHALPLSDDVEPITLGEGDTPLVRLSRVPQALDVGELWIKDESRNPTWSYKDRLIAVAITKARESGVSTVAVASTGNHGAAAAAYAARAGMECVVLTLSSVPVTMKTLMQSYGAHVVALTEPRDRWALLRQGVEGRGWTPLSGFVDPPAGSNPFGIDGYKSVAYEIVRDLGKVPTHVVVPVAYGDGLAGIMRGFEDLLAWGRIHRLPRLVAAEPIGPYAHALDHGFVSGHRLETRSSVAFSITTPVATFQGYDALHRSEGSGVAVPDADVMRSQLELAAAEGLYLEASSVITISVLPELVKRGEIGPDSTVVLLGTSTGLKDVGATAELLPPVTVIGPSLAELDEAIGASR
jgi:threonine synthase